MQRILVKLNENPKFEGQILLHPYQTFQFKENQRAAKGKGGNGRDTQMGRPPATNALVAPSTEQEKQDMLDQGP